MEYAYSQGYTNPSCTSVHDGLVYVRLIKFLAKHILNENQFGFRSNRSTIQAILIIADKIQRAIADKKISCGIFLDLRVIVRENQADDERWGSADSHHIFAVRYPYPTDYQGSILFSIALIGFEYDYPLIYPHFDHEYDYFLTNFNTSQLQSGCMLKPNFLVSYNMTLIQTNAY